MMTLPHGPLLTDLIRSVQRGARVVWKGSIYIKKIFLIIFPYFSPLPAYNFFHVILELIN